MKTHYYITTIISVLLMLCCGLTDIHAKVIAQKKGRTRLKVYYEKLANNDRQISLILNQGSGKQMAGVANAEIVLTSYNLDQEVPMPTLVTDANGEASLIIEAGYILPVNEDEYTVIKAVYKGNDGLKGVKKQIKFMDLNIDIAFDVVDSLKLITVSAFSTDSLGNKTPIEGVDINVGVDRLYSVLYLKKIATNSTGLAEMEFPNDVPGDSLGNLKLIVKINEDRKYGTITQMADIHWGTIVDYNNKTNGRSLFGDEAPLWMIIAVFIILAGAWYHFILAISKVVKMRKIAQEEALDKY